MTGIELIAAERRRQTTDKGWTAEHDDTHTRGELAAEAAAWALEGTRWAVPTDGMCGTAEHRRSKPRVRQLAIAGALIAAELDRELRAKGQDTSPRTPNARTTAADVLALLEQLHPSPGLCYGMSRPYTGTLDATRLHQAKRWLAALQEAVDQSRGVVGVIVDRPANPRRCPECHTMHTPGSCPLPATT